MPSRLVALPAIALLSIPAAAADSLAAPLDGLEPIEARVESELGAALAHLPELPGELWRAMPETSALLPALTEAVTIGAAALLGFVLVRRLTQPLRARAAHARNAFGGMLALAALEALALAVAAGIGRLVLVRWLHIPPGTTVFPAEATIAVVRWLFGLVLATLLFQPGVRRFRLVGVDDRGARLALVWIGALLALGHLHNILLAAAQRSGLPAPSAKLVSCLVALAMLIGAIRIAGRLRQNGLGAALRHTIAAAAIAVFGLWIWGWLVRDFSLYHGAVRTVAVLILGLALDRAVAISIRDSRNPEAMRLLFVVRVVIDGLAAALVTRIIVEFWVVGAFGWLPASEWPAVSRRFTFASAMLVLAITLAAIIHAWTEAKLLPPAEAETTRMRDARLQRLSTVLPMLRFAAITVVAVTFSLIALSTLGIDITPLMAGAGIIGLAISFGSQTLVKDIVSGVFYMLDDVFRLGETIETGGRRGQLEQINLRSVRLRDAEGRLHTIPLGDLGAVTNESRRLVRLTASVPVDGCPQPAALARFTRLAVAALHSEPMIHAGIVGEIEVTLPEGSEIAGIVAVGFNIAGTTAHRAEALIKRLIAEAADDAALPGAGPEVAVGVEDLSSPAAEPAPEPPRPAAMNMA